MHLYLVSRSYPGLRRPSLPGVIRILPLQGICNLQSPSLFLIFSPSLILPITHSPFVLTLSPLHPITPSLPLFVSLSAIKSAILAEIRQALYGGFSVNC